MGRIDYDVIFHALQLRSPAVTAGKLYAARFTRRGVDCLSHVERCMASGEVVFAKLSDPVTQAPCPVMFTEIKERRTVDVEIYDFTVQKRPEKLGSSSFDLIDVCDVSTRQKARKRIELRFRIAGKETLFEFVIIMTPAGQTPLERGIAAAPAAMQAPASSTISRAAASSSVQEQPRQVLPPAVCAFLVERGLVGGVNGNNQSRGSIEVVVDDDIAHEITARASQLMGKSFDHHLAPPSRIRQRDDLATEVRALEEALASNGSSTAAAGDMDQLMQQELVHWHQVIADWEAARDAAQRARDASMAKRQQQKNEEEAKSSTTRRSAGGDPNSIVGELEAQREALQEQLQELEAEQTRRDVTSEACAILEQISQITTIIEDAHQQVVEQQRQEPASGELLASERNELERLARDLLAAEVTLERNQYALAVAQSIMRAPPSRDGPPPPAALKCMTAAPLFSAQKGPLQGSDESTNSSSRTAPAVPAKKDTKDFMMEFFSDVATAPPASGTSNTGAPPSNAPSSSMDSLNLFSATTQVVAAEKPPKRSAQFVPFIPTPTALPDVRCGVAPSEIDFGDNSLIGYQVNVINDSHLTVTLENTVVVVEDLFSANEVSVDGIVFPKKLVVAANSSSMLYFGAYNQALLVCRGTMSLALKARATTSDATRPASGAVGEPTVFTIRLPSH